MRKEITLLLAIIFCAFQSYAQNTTLDFESAATGTGFSWTYFNNAGGTISTPSNPVSSGINTSATVLQYDMKQAADPWQGAYTDDIDPFTFDATNKIVTLKVYKPAISSFELKFESNTGGPAASVTVSNVGTNAWEELSFDFSSVAGNGHTYYRMVIVPDMNTATYTPGNGRSGDYPVYVDDINAPTGNVSAPTTVNVTFRVNAANVTTHANGIYLAGGNQFGSFNTNQMTQIGSTDVWEITLPATQNVGDHYTFVNGGTSWGDKENISGQSCADAGNFDDRILPAIWADTTILACFEDCSAHDASCPAPLASPASAAPVPSHDEMADNVLSIYSDSYTDVAGTNFSPGWGGTTAYSEEDLGSGNMAHKLATFGYQGTQLAANVDASGQGYLHIDYWTGDLGAFDFILIDSDPSTNVEITYAVNPTTTGAWQSIDIPMSFFAFSGLDISSINQIKIDGGSGSETIYFDNWYFHGTYDAPMAGAPDPTHDETNNVVVSIFGDTYTTDPSSINYDPDWGQPTDATEVSIDGSNTLQYLGLTYQGTDFSGDKQDVTGRDYLHFDYWASSTLTTFTISIISINSGTQEFAITPAGFTTGSWQSVDILLSDFLVGNGAIELDFIAQLKVDNGNSGTVWLDNIYFYNSVAVPVELTYFKGQEEGNTNVLSWETASEENNSHFEVERSVNGTDFEVIGRVEGNGTTIETINYDFVDEAPFANTYYRLRQVDFDGQFEYSKTVNMNRRQVGSNDVKVYPNPVQDNLTVDYVSSVEEDILITVTDITGRVLVSQNRNVAQGNNQLNIDLAKLPQGNYFVRLQSNTVTTIQAIVKK